MSIAVTFALALALPAVSALSPVAASVRAQHATMTPAQTCMLQLSFFPFRNSAENSFGRRPSQDGACRRPDRTGGPSLMTAAASTGRAAVTLGAARTAAIVLRGGTVESNVLGGVLAELANIRTPAALLGGAALGTMYVAPKPSGNGRLHVLYTALSTCAFSLQLVCVLCSTLTYTAVGSEGVAIAKSATAYLSEHMEFEFFVIRASFIYGLFSFLAALMVRGWMTFPNKGERGSARVMTAILALSTLFLLNFLHHTHNALTLCLGGMTKRLFWLTLSNMYRTRRRVIRHCTWIFATWAAVKLLKLGPNQGNERLGSPREKNNE